MSPLGRIRRSPWTSGALLLALAALLTVPILTILGLRYWPFSVGLAASLLLAFGWAERLWQSRPLPRHHRPKDRARLRVVRGGKGNGEARDIHSADDSDKPRWLM